MGLLMWTSQDMIWFSCSNVPPFLILLIRARMETEAALSCYILMYKYFISVFINFLKIAGDLIASCKHEMNASREGLYKLFVIVMHKDTLHQDVKVTQNMT